VLLLGLLVGIWWWVDAKNRYHGPVRTIDEGEFRPEPPPEVPPSAAIAGGSE
jgi:hypothetical protein